MNDICTHRVQDSNTYYRSKTSLILSYGNCRPTDLLI